MKTIIIATTALAAAALWLGGCAEKEVRAQRPESSEPTHVFGTIARAGRFATLVNALEVAGLVDTLRGPGPFTLFAPTDEAFAALPEGMLDRLLERPEELKALLLRHVVPAKMPSSEVIWTTTIRTIIGQRLTVTVENGIESIDGAHIIERDLMATNGIVHGIDGVLANTEAR